MTQTMLPVLHVLLVENEDPVIGQWNDAVEYHNADADKYGFYIETMSAKSVPAAKHSLEMHRFDAVIVDLRLDIEPGVTENNTTGNDLVRHLINNHPVGVIVHTGQRGEVEDYGYPQVRIFDKGASWDEITTWLAENKDVLLELRATKATFNRQTAKMFFKSIWPRWRHWKDDGTIDAAGLRDVLVRHVVAHVHDSLLNLGGGAVHPEESYFVPPLKDTLDTGDILTFEGQEWVVVTPRCDLANPGKTATVLLALCKEVKAEWDQLMADPSEGNKKKLDVMTQHRGSLKQHFLLPLRDLDGVKKGPWMVQFQDLKVVPASQAITDFPDLRLASLSPMYVPSLVERFGAYFSRIGTPGTSS